MNKTIDVVIPVYKPDARFKQLLLRLNKQNTKVRHIILMHTEDGTDLAWANDICDNVILKDLSSTDFDHGGTRDVGMRSSDADILVCITQDAVPVNKELIGTLEEALEQDGVAVAYARQLPNEDCDILERYTRKFNYPSESFVKSKEDLKRMGIKTYFCSNVCAAYKRDVYEQLGGFEKRTIFNEDMIFAAKAINANYKIAYVADALVLHSHNYTNMQQFKRNFDMAVSQANHPEIFATVKSESEGIRMVKETIKYLLRTGHPSKIFSLLVKSGAKYCGYFMGIHYESLPRKIVLHCTMNPRYWGKSENCV